MTVDLKGSHRASKDNPGKEAARVIPDKVKTQSAAYERDSA